MAVNTVEIVVFKMDTDGNTLWVKQSPNFNASGNNYDPTIAVDSHGNSYIAYYDDNPSSPATYYDTVAVFKLDTSGNLLWYQDTANFNTTGGNYNPNIAVDDSGNCYVAYFCDGSPASGQTETGQYDIVVFKMDTNSATQWIRQQPSFDTNASNFSPSIAVDLHGTLMFLIIPWRYDLRSDLYRWHL